MEEHPDNDIEDGDEPSESQTQLASFIISGDCPKCGRVVTKGHRQHLETCSGSARGPHQSLADMIRAEMVKIETEDKKLQQLELGGLVEFDDDHATFMVVGSKGNHYKIDFTMTKRKCQCLDHRIRKRDCKHIRLVLKALNIDDEPDKWKHATASLVEQQAAALKLDIKEEGKTEKCTTHWECKEGGGKNSGSKEHKVKHEPVSNT